MLHTGDSQTLAGLQDVLDEHTDERRVNGAAYPESAEGNVLSLLDDPLADPLLQHWTGRGGFGPAAGEYTGTPPGLLCPLKGQDRHVVLEPGMAELGC